MPFELKHPDLVEPLTFETPPDVKAWAEKELVFWSEIGVADLRAGQQARKEAEKAINQLIRQTNAPTINVTELQATLSAFASVVCLADGQYGRLLLSIARLGNGPKVVSAALAMLIKDSQLESLITNDHWTFSIAKAVGYVTSLEMGGDSQRLLRFLDSVAISENRWADLISRESDRIAQAEAQRLQSLALLQEGVDNANAKVAENTARHEDHIIAAKEKYEKAFSLQAPMKYWDEKAIRHKREATVYRWWFSGILVFGISALSLIGVLFLFPLLREKPDAYWAIVLFSIAIAILAWPMRLTSKLYLVHRHLAEDALEREVIVRTFLALDEKTKLPDSDRNLLLAALFRHASISLVSEDSGSGLSLPDIIAAKGIMKS